MNENKKAIQAGFAYTIASFLVAGISFITTPIYTRILSVEEYGSFNNFTSWLSILMIVITLKLSASFISARFDFKETFDKYIFSIMTLNVIIVIFCLLIINIFIDFFMKIFDLNRLCINLMLAYILFYEIICIYQAREQFSFRYRNATLISTTVAIATTLLSILCIIKFEDKFIGRIVGYTLPAIVIGAVIYFLFYKKNKGIDIKYWKYAIPITIPYIPHSLSLILLNSMDKIMIIKIWGDAENGLYSLAYTCSSLVTVLMSSINSAYGPWLTNNLNMGEHREVRKVSYVYVLCFMFLVIGIMLVAPEVMLILGGEAYQEAIYVMPPVMMGCAFQLIYTMYVNIEQFKKKTVGMAFASIIAAISNYVLNYIFIPRKGYLAAAYTTLASYIILTVLHILLVKKIKMGNIYNNKFMVCVIIMGCVLCVGMNILYRNNILRYGGILLYTLLFLILAWKYKEKLLSLLKKEGKKNV